MARQKKADPAAAYPSTEEVLSRHGQAVTLREAALMIVKRNPFLRVFGPGCSTAGELPWNLMLSLAGSIDGIGGKPNDPAVIVFDPPAEPAGMPWAFEGLLSAGGKLWAIGPRLGVCPRDPQTGAPLLGAEYEAAVAAHTATVYGTTAEGGEA